MSLFDNIKNRIGLASLLVLFLVGLTSVAHAQGNRTINILVVLSKSTLPYQKFSQQLKKTLSISPSSEINFHVVDADIVNLNLAPHESGIIADYIIAVGTLAAKKLITIDVSTPIIFSLIPSSSYQSKIENSPYCRVKAQCSAIYLEQPIDRQFFVIRKSLPDIKMLGVILGPTSIKMQDQIIRAAKKHSLNVNIKLADKNDNTVILSQQLSRTNDALLAIPDPDIYNRRTAKGILLSTYKHKTPFIAYSHGFVRAGALFSIYATPEQIATQTANMLIRTIRTKNKTLPAPEYPDHYKLEVNAAVIRSLRRKINFDSSILDNQ